VVAPPIHSSSVHEASSRRGTRVSIESRAIHNCRKRDDDGENDRKAKRGKAVRSMTAGVGAKV
jgi:hypothetical protein